MTSILSEVTAEEFQRLYWEEEMTLKQIGELYGVSSPTVAKWMEHHGIKRKAGIRVSIGDGNQVKKSLYIRSDQEDYVRKHPSINVSGLLREALDRQMEMDKNARE